MTTTSPVTLLAARPEDHEALGNLWLLFRHDMSAWTGAVPDPRGRFRDDRLRSALSGDPDWRAYLLWRAEAPVGLALVRGVRGEVRVLNSYFVVAAARRAGVGLAGVRQLFAQFPGRWEVAFQDVNTRAVAFWRAAATDAAGSAWTEEHRAVPGRPDLPPDTWISLTVPV
ncbi:GNAT family N-acetyltransferase [Georgenia alba]|uniref:GNAT family N-acetyltransferase n=1 Tax=Georgenia alba TaxID=2233858 RepID=A0ABW2Q5N5_9MICO